MGLDRDWQSTRIRKRNQIQETMVETKRNEAINQIVVGGYVRATKPAAANILSVVDTEKRNEATEPDCHVTSQDPENI